VVLRVRGSTGSLGKTDIAKRLWRQLALSGVYIQNPARAVVPRVLREKGVFPTAQPY
jgi:hypothetical protein